VLPAFAAFSAGFFGPMVFSPESNLGPIIGILFSGPAGLVLGFVLWLLAKVLPLSPRVQWRALTVITLACALVVLPFVQPEPARLGDMLELEVRRVHAPSELADAAVADWRRRVAEYPNTPAQPGWEVQRRATLANDEGAVLEAVVVRERSILAARRIGQRGQLSATAWVARNETRSFYLPPGMPGAWPVPGARVTLFRPNDTLHGIESPREWPPHEVQRLLVLSPLTPVPEAYAGL